jgi:phosphate starvation-inducible membrane PsiE
MIDITTILVIYRIALTFALSVIGKAFKKFHTALKFSILISIHRMIDFVLQSSKEPTDSVNTATVVCFSLNEVPHLTSARVNSQTNLVELRRSK